VHWEEVRGPSAIVLLPLGLRRVDSVTHPGHDDDDTNGPVASTTDSDQESGKKSNEPKKGGGAKPKPPSRTVRVTRGGVDGDTIDLRNGKTVRSFRSTAGKQGRMLLGRGWSGPEAASEA
jgi:hypothetical protein